MEEAEEEPPFWLKSSGNPRRGGGRPTSIFLNSGVLLVSLLVVASVFIFVIVPSFVSFTSQIFKPHLVKKSWDSLNLVLVLFAIVCGFLSRNSNVPNQDQSSFGESEPHDLQKSSSLENREDRWYGYSDRTVAYPAMSRLRSSSSYPDLRVESSWTESGDRWRFYDDSDVIGSRVFRSDLREMRMSRGGEKMDLETREVEVDTFVVASPAYPPPIPSPPSRVSQSLPQKKRSEYQEIRNFEKLRPRAPPSPPPVPSWPSPEEVASPAPKRAHQSLPRKNRSETQEIGIFDEHRARAPPSPPPEVVVKPPPQRAYHSPQQNQRREDREMRNYEQRTPPEPPSQPEKAAKRKAKRGHQTSDREERSESSDFEASASQPPPSPPPIGTTVKRRGGTKDFLIALRRRKKKQRQRSVENLESFFSLHEPPHAPPPPPPPPPPPSVFHALFSTKKSSNKTKKPPSVPPPPPPPPSVARGSRSQTRPPQSQAFHVSTRKPPLPVRTSSISDETTNPGNMSPLIPIPPPPPPPPFKMQAWRFKRHGDFVRINSDNSDRSGSPELDDVEVSSGPSSSSNTPKAMDGGDSPARLFCPSPDVDTKADSFIARFRAGLNLERNRSNLGREPSPSPEPGPI